MPKPSMKMEPVDPRMEVANEIKQHLLGLALTHRKMRSKIETDAAAKKKKPKKKEEEDDETPMHNELDAGDDDVGDHEYR